MKKVVFFLVTIMVVGFYVYGVSQQFNSGKEDVQKWKDLAQVHLYKKQNPGENYWVHLLLSSESIYVNCIKETIDGGFIIAGKISYEGGQYASLVIKLNQYGQIEWKKFLLDSQYKNFVWSYISQITQANDGSYVLVGRYLEWTMASSMLIKLSLDGVIESSRYYLHGFHHMNFESIDNTYDGGFVIAGNYVGIESPNNEKLFVRKLSSDLSDQWHFIMDLEGVNRRLISIRTIIQTADKGFLVTMDTQNMEEEDSISGNKWPDLWLIKLSETGGIEWQKTYGGVESEWMIQPGPYVFETAGGNIYLIGNSLSFYNSNGISTWDVWVLKLFSNGDIQWQRRYDGGKGDFANSALMTPENGLIICGSTYSSANTSKEESSFLLFKISPDGEIQWQRAYAYSEDSNEVIRTLCQTHDGKIVFVGRTGIFHDAVLMKVSETGYLNILGCTLKYRVDLKAMNTNVVPKNTFVKKKEISNSFIQAHIENVDINFFKRTICWNFIKPPLDVSLEQEFNRGLFGGEALNYVKWNPNPKNSSFSVDQYLVYRKESSIGDTGYELIATVPAGVYEYVDDDTLLEDKFDYMVTAVDTEGRESAWSRSKANGN